MPFVWAKGFFKNKRQKNDSFNISDFYNCHIFCWLLFIQGTRNTVRQENLDKMYAQLLYATGLKIQINAAKDMLICAQISKDWSTAITKGKDFNDAIQNTLKIAEDGGLMQTIRDDKESIDTAMNKLNEPPKQYKALYDKLLSLYGEYSKVYEQTISPSGSLLTYNSTIKKMSSEITGLFNEFEAMVPQKIMEEVNNSATSQ